MKKTINFCEFCDAWEGTGRENSFSYEGKEALFCWLDDMEQESGLETKLDIIALDCEFVEYKSIADFNADYNLDAETIEEINNYTIVIPIENSDGFIIQNF